MSFSSYHLDPQKAYTDNQQQAKGNYDWMVTVNEFNKAIEKLHENNYILIDHMMLMI